jgi:hypothetical protein
LFTFFLKHHHGHRGPGHHVYLFTHTIHWLGSTNLRQIFFQMGGFAAMAYIHTQLPASDATSPPTFAGFDIIQTSLQLTASSAGDWGLPAQAEAQTYEV